MQTTPVEIEVMVKCAEEQKHPIRLRIVSWEQWEVVYTPCEKLLGRAFGMMAPCNRYVHEKRHALKQDVISQLVTQGPPAVPILIEALSDFHVVYAAIEALGQIGDISAAPVLRRALEIGRLRLIAAEALGRIRDASAVPQLIRLLKDQDPSARWVACRSLGWIGDKTAIPALESALEDSYRDWWGEYPIRTAACEALEQIGTPAIPALIRALTNTSEEIRDRANSALARMGVPQADSLCFVGSVSWWGEERFLEEIKKNKEIITQLFNAVGALLAQSEWWGALQTNLHDKSVRTSVVQHSQAALPMLIDALGHSDVRVGWGVCQALAEMGDSAVSALIEVLEDENRVLAGRYVERTRACQALGLAGVDRAVPVLLEALRDRHAEVRAAACEALGHIGNPRAVPALCCALEDKDWSVRNSACIALGILGSVQATSQLIKVVGDPDGVVRASACWALGRIGDVSAAPALRIHAEYLSEARIALYCLDAPETTLQDAVKQVLAQPQWWGVLIRALTEEQVRLALQPHDGAALTLYTLAARDSDPEVRRIAANALMGIEASLFLSHESATAQIA